MPKPQAYKDATPKLDLFEYFAGKTYAWGQFQDRSGQVIRKFKVDITGTIHQQNQPVLVLDEKFLYSDGETESRVWTIKEQPAADGLDKAYIGTAGDVVGEAIGELAGNALNWRYVLDMPYKDGTIKLNFDDWMFLHDNDMMLNRAKVSKWGFHVGEVTLMFSKQPPAGWN